jgi:hypothetical protein
MALVDESHPSTISCNAASRQTQEDIFHDDESVVVSSDCAKDQPIITTIAKQISIKLLHQFKFFALIIN